MSAPKHTPGPWMTDDREPSDQFRYVLDCSGQRAWIARLPLQTVIEEKGFRHEQEANATLIAAAPEMLEALKAVMSYRTASGMAIAFDKARAAIAKAEGTA